MRISDWSSDVCSSDLLFLNDDLGVARDAGGEIGRQRDRFVERVGVEALRPAEHRRHRLDRRAHDIVVRSEEHTSELQSLMRISYAVFCLKKKKKTSMKKTLT